MVSEKEIEAAREVLEQRVYDEGGCEAQQVPAMVREMLQAAARVRAEANAGEPVDQTTFTVSQEGFKKFLDATENPEPPNEKLKELFRQYCAMHPAPQPSGPVGALEEEVYEKAWVAFRDSDKPAIYNQVKDAVNAALSALTAGKPEQMPSIQQVRKR